MPPILTAKIAIPRRYKDRSGDVIGRLTVLHCVGVKGPKNAIWLCRCSCGETCNATTTSLRLSTRSCGCMKRESDRNRFRKHGMDRTPEHMAWMAMNRRVRNKNQKYYHLYGGRGISICERWSGECGFSNFLADMGKKPSQSHSLDRINVNGNYEPSNCRWATSAEQARNKRTNRTLSANGKTMCIADWADHLGLHRSTIEKRLKRMAAEKALTA